ncbi:hypothetical protein HK405_003166, partial [Cladochytrium tenue]
MLPASAIASTYTVTASATTYNPGDKITITIAGAAYNGFLGYATATASTNYVGTWTFPTGYQNNNAFCATAGVTTDSADSTITHTAGQTFNGATLTYTAPATSVGDLSFNFIVVAASTGGGYAHSILANAVTVKAATTAATMAAGTAS